jgi:hypothetical protein
MANVEAIALSIPRNSPWSEDCTVGFQVCMGDERYVEGKSNHHGKVGQGAGRNAICTIKTPNSLHLICQTYKEKCTNGRRL